MGPPPSPAPAPTAPVATTDDFDAPASSPASPAAAAAATPSAATAAPTVPPTAPAAADPGTSTGLGVPAPPATPSPAAGGTTGGNDARTRRRLAVACAALFVLSVGLALLSAVLATRLESERSRTDEVEEVSGRFATALLTYSHDHLDQAKERVLALSTGKFRREYEQAFANGLDTLIKETKATSSGTVTDVFVGAVDGDTASAIVVANAVSEGTSGTRRTVASYIQLELVRVSGEWRVDGVTNLNFGQNSGADGVPAASTTTTSAPPK
ncbi:MAG TPA: hypothetical protein VGB03_01840 [Acidimicrobiales bacterium]